ncbi:MAG: type II secretion system protein GspL [Gammaproteobacteria bacterium]|jgi:general secretion pathway protein L|nr:type II secretion system protein GspL [Gammaproteobacteria bacterium]MDH3758943.1 type II secretion system protein GspL [Gammaproteobacteria bacterium]MDH3846477.1 type II secretion system protein GspL [Gammaproteobacteria bacterium]MDH3863168.1 type II secretion system protein GspL [Gammaproteobacteria bacterium]MDH3906226.1 type II secretion system protein GspL [Gammaproteobacteria bacterium]
MTEFLVIRLGADENTHASWIAVDDAGTRRTPPVMGPLQEAVKDVGDREVIVLVPAGDTSTLTCDLPAKGARLRAALPFALEEQVADEIENLHFAAGNRRSGGELPVVVVAHDRMNAWLEQLRDAGIKPARLVPEDHGLAFVPNTLSMLLAEDQIIFNDGADLEFVMQGVTPTDALMAAGILGEEGLADEAEDVSRHLLVYCEPTEEQRFEHDWARLRQHLESVDINLLPDGVLPRLAVTVASGVGVDLLQGRYGESMDLGAVFRPWRYAAMLLLAFGVLGIAGKGIDYFRLASEEAALKEQFTVEYRKIRPDDTREVMDPLGTVTSIRRSIGAGGSAPAVFLPSLQQLAIALRENKDAEILAISYRAGVIDVRLTAPDVATLDKIQKIISQSTRFTASIQSTDRVGDEVNSRIQIREVGS